MKFDLRKYIFANTVSVLMYVLAIVVIIMASTSFPPPEPCPGYQPEMLCRSNEEMMYITIFMLLSFLVFFFLFLLPVEIIVRFLFNKFLSKYFDKKENCRFKFPKFVIVIYSFLFYLGLSSCGLMCLLYALT